MSLSTDSCPRRINSQTKSGGITPRVSQKKKANVLLPILTLTQQRRYFRDAVRERDGHCMLSGQPNPDAVLGDYSGLHASHIFPYAREGDWRARNFQQYVTDNSPASHIGSSRIHSPQNGFLVSSTLHELFDAYRVSVNPDVGYLS